MGNEDNNKAKNAARGPEAVEPTPSLSEIGARLLGEGGTVSRQAGPRDRLHGARRKSRGREIHCKARGRRAVAMRGVWITPEHMKWKKGTDGGSVGGRMKKRDARCSCSRHARERLPFS